MFRFHKTLDVLTLFHAPASPPSRAILSLLRAQSSANAQRPFEIDVVEAPKVPTASQLTSILEFLGHGRAGEVVRGARSDAEAVKLLGEGGGEGISSEKVVRPLLVDWSNGRVVVGGDEAAAKRLVESLLGS